MQTEFENFKDALVSVLNGIPFVDIRSFQNEFRIDELTVDAVVTILVQNQPKRLLLEYKSNGEIRYVRNAILSLERYIQDFPNGYGVLVAPYISQESANLLAHHNIGFVDLAGNCKLVFDGVFIERSGYKNLTRRRSRLRTLYSPKASRILRILLVNPRRSWRLEELAGEAVVSIGLVSNVKRALQDREWITHERSSLMLTQPERLLGEWSENYSNEKNETTGYYANGTLSEIELRLTTVAAEFGVKCALTGFSAATRLSPMVKYNRAMAYCSKMSNDMAREAGLKEVDSGANITVLKPYDAGVYYACTEIDGVPIVSAIQAYLDVNRLKSRGEEAGRALLERRIKPSW